MANEEREAENAVDPGDPVVPSTEEGFPEAQILVDEETGRHFLAFEIDPDAVADEGEDEGDAGKEE